MTYPLGPAGGDGAVVPPPRAQGAPWRTKAEHPAGSRWGARVGLRGATGLRGRGRVPLHHPWWDPLGNPGGPQILRYGSRGLP